MLYIARSLNYIEIEKFNEIYNLTCEISKILSGLIKSVGLRTND